MHATFAPLDRILQIDSLASSEPLAGSGVGLATVGHVMERHGGAVWAEGRAGAGSGCHVTWQPDPAKIEQP